MAMDELQAQELVRKLKTDWLPAADISVEAVDHSFGTKDSNNWRVRILKYHQGYAYIKIEVSEDMSGRGHNAYLAFVAAEESYGRGIEEGRKQIAERFHRLVDAPAAGRTF